MLDSYSSNFKNKGKVRLDTDIIYYLATNHLEDCPSSIASLSLTSRTLYELLRYVKFQSIRLKVRCQGDFDTDSPAERLAQKLEQDPKIINHVQSLWVGREGSISLPALHEESPSPSVERERDSIRYVLDRPYTVLRRLTLSAMTFTETWSYRCNMPAHLRTSIPRNIVGCIWRALEVCVSLDCVERLEVLVDPIPSALLRSPCLLHLAMLRISGGPERDIDNGIYNLSLGLSSSHQIQGGIKCQPEVLEIDHHSAARILRLQSVFSIDPTRLTTLIIKDLCGGDNTTLSNFASACSSTLTTLRVFYEDWQNMSGPGGNGRLSDLLLHNSRVLRHLTLATNYSIVGERARGNIRSFTRTLSSCIQSASSISSTPNSNPTQTPRLQASNLQYITLIFRQNVDHNVWKETTHLQWLDRVRKPLWRDLDDLFAPEQVQRWWANLRRVRMGFVAQDMEYSVKESLEARVRSRLGNLERSGLLKLVTEGYLDALWSHSLWTDD